MKYYKKITAKNGVDYFLIQGELSDSIPEPPEALKNSVISWLHSIGLNVQDTEETHEVVVSMINDLVDSFNKNKISLNYN